MNSFDSNSFKMGSSNKQHVRNTTSTLKSSGANNTSNTNKIINSDTQPLVKGQILKAEVIDLRGSDIKIQFDHGEIISAKVNTDVPISIGEQVTFQVEDASITSISLKVMADNRLTSQSIIIDKALENANLPRNSRNMLIVQELLSNQMSIDKDSLLKIIQQSIQFKGASVQTLVLMNKFGIPINETNIQQFDAFQNYEHRIVSGTMNLLNTLTEMLPQATADNIKELHQLLLNICGKQPSYINSSEPDYPKTDTSPFSSPKDLTSPSNILSNHGNTDVSVTVPNPQEFNSPQSFSEQAFSNPDNNYSLMESNLESRQQPETTSAFTSLLVNDLLSKEEQNAFLKVLPETLQRQITEKLINNTCTVFDLISDVNQHMDVMDPDQQKTLLKSPAYHSIMKEAILSQWTLRPSDLKNHGSIERFYEQLENDFKELMHIFNAAKDTTNFSMEVANKQVQNLQDNVDFMKTLNQVFPYVQIPLKLSNQNVHSELYVYKRKKAKTDDTQNVSVLLHLDMEQLGPLDIHLDLLKTKIHTKIYTNTIESKLILDDHIDLLKTVLENKGYAFHCEIMKREEKTNLMNEISKQADGDVQMKRYSFDIRA